jgi:hypothetical protein
MARVSVHVGGSAGAAAHRLYPSPTNHLAQNCRCLDSYALLVPARAMLVCAQEECAVVWQAWREHDHLRRGFTEDDHGRLSDLGPGG